MHMAYIGSEVGGSGCPIHLLKESESNWDYLQLPIPQFVHSKNDYNDLTNEDHSRLKAVQDSDKKLLVYASNVSEKENNTGQT